MYSDDYTHTDVRMRRLDASRKLYDQCDDNAFVACMAEKTETYTDNNGDSFITSCEDDDHDHYYDDWSYSYDDDSGSNGCYSNADLVWYINNINDEFWEWTDKVLNTSLATIIIIYIYLLLSNTSVN